MKVLVSSINFAPDHAGIGVYSTDFPLYLAEQGDEVAMVTGFPYYPQWQKRTEDKGRCFARESYHGVSVYRGYLHVPKRVSTIGRLWHELTFCLFAGINFIRAGRPDVIVLFTPPFFLGVVGVLMKWIWRRPLVINIQDLPLDAAMALGMVKRGLLSRGLHAFEAWLYRRADMVATISPIMIENVRAKGVSESHLALVPNWIDVQKVAATSSCGGFLAGHPQAQGKFVVAYAGNLGIKQGVDLLLRLAKSMEETKQVHFFVIGDGADKPRLLALQAELGCRNVSFLPFMAPEEYRAMLAEIDLVFVAQRSGAGNNFFPSKLLGLMAQSKPLLIAADEESELARVIRDTGCGVVSRYGDVEGMAANLRTIIADREKLKEMGGLGHRRVWEYDRARVLSEWRSRIASLVNCQS